jgi:hypothetical protein
VKNSARPGADFLSRNTGTLCLAMLAAAAVLARISLGSDWPFMMLLAANVIAITLLLLRGEFEARTALAAVWTLGAIVLMAHGLRPPHLYLDDSMRDLGAVRAVLAEGRWHPGDPPKYVDAGQYALASASVVPAVLSVVLGIPPERVLQIVYPAVFSLAIVVVFVLTWRLLKDPWPAMAAAVFLVSEPLFGPLSTVSRTSVSLPLFSTLLTVLFCYPSRGLLERFASPLILAAGLIASYYNAAMIAAVVLWGIAVPGNRTRSRESTRRLRALAAAASVLVIAYYFAGFTSNELGGALRAVLVRGAVASHEATKAAAPPPLSAPSQGPAETSGAGVVGIEARIAAAVDRYVPRSWGPAIRFALGMNLTGTLRPPLALVELGVRYLALAVIGAGVRYVWQSPIPRDSKSAVVVSIVIAIGLTAAIVLIPAVSTIVEISTITLLGAAALSFAFGAGMQQLRVRWGRAGIIMGAGLVAALCLYSTGLAYQVDPKKYNSLVWVSEETVLSNRSLAHDKFFVWTEDIAAVAWLARHAEPAQPLHGDYIVRYLYVYAPPESWPFFPRYVASPAADWSDGYVLLRRMNNATGLLWPGWAWRDPEAVKIPASLADLNIVYSDGSDTILQAGSAAR